MSQVSYGTITITDTNDIESITVEYARNQDPATAPGTGWNTTRPDWEQGYYIWQRTRIHKSGTSTSSDTFGAAVCLTGSTGSTGASGRSLTNTITQYTTAANNVTITEDNMGSYTWSNNVPSYNSNTPVYWVRITNTYSNPAGTQYIIYKDNGLTDAISTSVAANTTANAANQTANAANQTANAALNSIQAKYATSSTVATSTAKIATFSPTVTGWSLFSGAEIFVRFTNKNTIASPTLNVNQTGAKSIKDSDGNDLAEKFYWKDNSLVHFVYDSTNWRILDIVTAEKYNTLVSDIDGISQTVGTKASQTDLTNLTTRVSTNETNISQTATSITSLVSNQDTYTAPDGTTKTNTIKSAIKQNADNIDLKVSKDGVIASINASVETSGGSAVKISADKVNIEGAAIFTSGRLSTTNLNNTIDGRIPEIPDDISDLSDNTGIIPDVSGLASKTDTVKSVTTETQYRLSNSSTSLTGSGTGYSWSTTIPTWSSNKYLWTRIATTYTPISGSATTVYKPGTQTNEYGIYDSQLTIALSTASSAQTTANGAAASVTTTQQYNLSSSTDSANGTWQDTVPTWSANNYIWVRLKIVKTPMSGTATTSYTPSESGTYDKALTTALSTAASAKTTAENAAPKSSAIAEEQRIYYRSSAVSNNIPIKPNGNGLPTAWVTETGDKYNSNATTASGWSKKITPIANSTESSATKYLYLWTCIQRKKVNGDVTYGDILLDDSTTVIDGGKIITGSVTANQLNAADINASNSLTIGAFNTTTQDNILNSQLTPSITAAQTTADNASYSVEIEVSSIDFVNNNAILIAHPYFKGVKLTSSTTPALSTITGYSWSRADGTAIPSGVTTNAKTLQLPNNSDLSATYVCMISKA